MQLLVILDNGHGGMINGEYQTPGKRSPVWPDGSQLFEGIYNRQIVKEIAKGLAQFGIEYHILVPEEEDISLQERVKRVNNLCKVHGKDRKVILCSVHGNAAGSPDAKGFEVFTTPGQTHSDIIADIYASYCRLYFSEASKFRADKTDGDEDKEARFYIITKTMCPAILTENGFFTNQDECRRMLTPLWVELVARVHVQTFKEYSEKIKSI